MGTVTVWPVAGPLTVAQSYRLFFRDFKLDRQKGRPFVRTIAKRLVFRLAAAAPVVRARFQIQRDRVLITHLITSLLPSN